MRQVTVIGGGLAGSEAAWQIARRGVPVQLVEMRPQHPTPVHHTDLLAELVCSNSLRSEGLHNAHGLLKEEMRRLGSLIMTAATHARVPAGQALAVDRVQFASRVTQTLLGLPLVELIREEIDSLPEDGIVVVATGPLTSASLSTSITAFTGKENLFFYDAISPLIEAETIDESKVFRASRYGKGGEDYINCPLTETDYQRFHQALLFASPAQHHEIDKGLFFEGCLPIEVLARRGYDTLRFGPMKPVGLIDPRTGKSPFAAVQLRQDNLASSLYNMVGFQNQLRWSEQKKVFRLIPGLEAAEFARYGMIHRNTYINAPAILKPTLQAHRRTDLFFAGQISGVEGYTESAASGLMAGINAARLALGSQPEVPPRTSAMGSLAHYISLSTPDNYQPSNIAFGLLPELDGPKIRNKHHRRQALAIRALEAIDSFAVSVGEPLLLSPEAASRPMAPQADRRTSASHA